MTAEQDRPELRYLLDENVSQRVADILIELGREVKSSREVSGLQAADHLVEHAAAEGAFVLITHDRHFKTVTAAVTNRKSAPTLWVRVSEPRAPARIRHCLPVAEHLIHDAAEQGMDLKYIEIHDKELRVKYIFPPDE